MKQVKIAIISDVHIGLGARSKDLCPKPSKKNKKDSIVYNKKIEDNYCEKFVSFIKEKSLETDYLMISGDLTHKAHPNEIKMASEFIASLRKSLKVKERDVIFTPGNHDVDWSILDDEDSTGIRWENRYEVFKHKSFQFQKIIDRADGDLYLEPYFSTWSFDDLIVSSYNTSHHDDPYQANHYGLIDIKHVEQLRTYLKSIELPEEKVRIFLIHHHPILYSEPFPGDTDFSAAQNAEKLLSILNEFHFDVLIHGHRHCPRFRTHSIDGFPHLAILGAGSFSAEFDSRWYGAVNNQFHIIHALGREKDDSVLKGYVESWGYTFIKGWEKSTKDYAGIHHIEPFGTYMLPHKLSEYLKPIIKNRLKKSDYIEWKDIIEEHPQLKHLRTETVLMVLDSLSSTYKYRRMYDTPEKIILLK